MKVIPCNLLSDVSVSYDKTKTSISGRVFQKTINGENVLGPPLTNFIDVFTYTVGGGSVTPNGVYLSPNGRLFIAVTPAAGLMTVLLYDFDLTLQTAPIYIGRILVAVPNAAATTQTLRQFEVDDGASSAVVTGWKIIFSTVGSILINGGSFVANNISKSQFVFSSPPTIGLAIASDANAVYMLQDPSNIGVNNNITAIQGAGYDRSGKFLYVNNNVLATTHFIKWDLNTALTYSTQTTTAPTSIGSPTFTLAGHSFNNNDPVVLISNVPGGFTATTTTIQTVYFIRNAVAGVSFELSATSGGASINATTATASTVIGRAFGQITTPWLSVKTGTVTGISGTILLTQSHMLTTPSSAIDPNIPAGLSGQLCYFLPTSTFFHLFKVSDITNGATSFPSLSLINPTGTGVDVTAITPVQATYVSSVGKTVYTSNTSAFYGKSWLSGSISHYFGGLNTTWWENTPTRKTTNFSAVAPSALNSSSGVGIILFSASTAGQRGIYYMDFKSDYQFDYSNIVSPVLDTSEVDAFEFMQTIEELFDFTNSLEISYRTAATSGDAIFNTASGSWTVLPNNESLSAFALNNYTQFRIRFFIADLTAQTPAQVQELYISYTGKNELSDHWEGSVDNSTRSSESPAHIAFRMIKVYSGGSVALRVKAYDDTNTLVFSKDTDTDYTFFDKSTNNGSSWSAMTGANDYANTALTTEIRVNPTSLPNDKLTWSIREK